MLLNDLLQMTSKSVGGGRNCIQMLLKTCEKQIAENAGIK